MSEVMRRAMIAGIASLPIACRAPNTDRTSTTEQPATVMPKRAAAQGKASAARNGLVELLKRDPSIKLDIRYATPDNVTGRTLYTQPRAFLIEDAAEALLQISARASRFGFGLMIFDAYRPWRVTKALWDATPPAQRSFVANPKEGSRHNRGSAVDLTLYDLKTGSALPMPSAFDDFSKRAHRDFAGGSDQERRNRDTLAKLMESQGFLGRWDEWWHYDWKGWERYPVLDILFEDL
jgi:D-alanyl-D-alanine dipeptidase